MANHWAEALAPGGALLAAFPLPPAPASALSALHTRLLRDPTLQLLVSVSASVCLSILELSLPPSLRLPAHRSPSPVLFSMSVNPPSFAVSPPGGFRTDTLCLPAPALRVQSVRTCFACLLSGAFSARMSPSPRPRGGTWSPPLPPSVSHLRTCVSVSGSLLRHSCFRGELAPRPQQALGRSRCWRWVLNRRNLVACSACDLLLKICLFIC